jgi:hypothetical protein
VQIEINGEMITGNLIPFVKMKDSNDVKAIMG